MSRILVIEPHKMLQHAFSVALFPEHSVEVIEMIPDAAAVKDVDLVIVDAAALRERDSLAARQFHDVQSWKTPTIWIDQETDSQAPTREKFVVVRRPSGKDSLQRAMAECLGTADGGKQATNLQNSHAVSPVSATGLVKEQERAAVAANAEENFIELVEVVEEGSAREKSKAPQKKTK
jgi:hypothetical protein